MVKSICEQDKTIKEKSRAFYIRHALKFFKEYMSLPENENKPINAITYYDVNCYLDTLPYSDNHKANVYNSLKKIFKYKLPLKVELQLIISQYLRLFENSEEKIVSVDENSLSSYISNITKKITSKSYSPKVFARTFVVKALEEGNRIWEVSNLVLESVGHIAKLIDEDPEKLFLQQSIILSKL